MATTYPTYTAPASADDIRRMAGVNDALLLIGRVALAVMFIFSGYSKFMDLSGTAAMIASKGLPMPMTLAALAATAEVLGGLMVIFGWQTRIAALGLVVFTAVTTFYFHDFWNMVDQARQTNMIHAMKNLSVVGGLLMLAAVGAGRYSIDGPCIVHQRSLAT